MKAIPFVMKDLDLQCENGTLTAIIGHVGCGKQYSLQQ